MSFAPDRLSLPVRLLGQLLLSALTVVAVLLPDHLFGLLYPTWQVQPSPKIVAAVFLAAFLALSARTLRPYRVLLVFFALLQLPQLYHFVYFGTFISPQEVGLLGSELEEVALSLAGIWPALIAPTLMVLGSYALMWWLAGRLSSLRQRIPASTLLLVLLLGGILPVKAWHSTGSQAFYPNPRHYTVKNTLYAVGWFLGKELPRRFAGEHQQREFAPYRVAPAQSVLPANVVLVMGESLNPDHMGLFGYERDTTPHFTALKGEPGFYFTRIYSGGVSTKVAVPTFFNLKREPENVQVMYRGDANLFKLAKSRGLRTWWLSTQNSNLATYAGGGAVDHFESREDHLEEIERRKDEVLLDLLEQVDFTRPNFVVLHERGSHSPYERYHTDEYRVYPEDRTDIEQFRVNSYDNSIRFSDEVHHRILELLRQRSTLPTYVIFTADHGELLGDEIDGQPLWGHSVLHPKTATVPFILYAINGDPGVLERARALPWPTHFELGRFVAGLFGYRVEDPYAEEGVYYANGKDIAGASGYMRMQFDRRGRLVDWQVVLP
jgi:glucan phosphoethanolaminetransferase (alkaline phosphatase superfamily)